MKVGGVTRVDPRSKLRRLVYHRRKKKKHHKEREQTTSTRKAYVLLQTDQKGIENSHLV